MPYPCSYTTVPFRLIAKLQPGETDFFHSANRLSPLVVKDWADKEFSLVGLGSLARAGEAIAAMTKKQSAPANIFMISAIAESECMDLIGSTGPIYFPWMTALSISCSVRHPDSFIAIS